VQYFGKVVPEIEDKSALYNYYEQGDWIVSTSEYLEELASDKLSQVYYKEKTKGKEKEDTGGALFHKSAAGVRNGAAGN
jgi:hypothetical protein